MMDIISTNRGTARQIVVHKEPNWAGDKFKTFQSDRITKVITTRKNKTTLSTGRGTVQKILKTPFKIESKAITQVYISTNRGTGRRLLNLRWRFKINHFN